MKVAYIYLLIDPRNGKECYLGYTNNLRNRLYQHINQARLKPYLEPLSSKRSNNPNCWICYSNKSKWIRELLDLNLKPEIRTIAIVDNQNKAYYEWFWGQIYADAKLLNDKPFNRDSITSI